jgi:competence protein ComEC
MQKLAAYQPLYMQKITLVAQANEDAIYDKTKQLEFTGSNISLENGQRLTGKIQLGGFGANAVFQGDKVVVTGKLYPGYGAYQGSISFATLHVIAHHPSLISEIRRRFTAGAQTALPEPLAPFAMGLLVGQRATLPQTAKDDLRKVGLTHIIAVSGYNLTIILQASRRLLGKKSKRLSTFLSVSLIGVFLLLAGASASIVRAAIVSTLSIMTNYYGRAFRPLNLILLAAAITAWANPIYLWSDLSWYLSFLAFYGVMILSPLVQARWPAKWHQSVLGGVALESLCAEVMTLPFVLHIFGQMSRVGLLANVLVVSLVPLAMLLGTVAGLAGMLVGTMSGWFAWPATLLLNYMLDVAHVLAGLPHIFVEGIGLSLTQMLILYGCIVVLTAVLWYKTAKSAIITDMIENKSRSLLA